MKEEKVIVSENANQYFKDFGITSHEWIQYCAKSFNLQSGDIVFYEGSTIGYVKMKK